MESKRLAAIPLYSSLPEAELAAVASVASEFDLDEGGTLTAEDDLGHAIFAIEQGTAAVKSDGATIGVVGPGDVVGEVAVLASGRRTASVLRSACPHRHL
jgi:CRP-like cAMP-binding protein